MIMRGVTQFPAAFTVFRLLKAALVVLRQASLNHAAKVTLDVETHGYWRASCLVEPPLSIFSILA